MLEDHAIAAARPERDCAAEVLFFALTLLFALAAADLGDLAALFVAGVLVAKTLFRPRPGDWVYALGGALVGGATDLALSRAGLLRYATPGTWGIPLWTPLLWAAGGQLLRRLVVYIGYLSGPDNEQHTFGGPAGELALYIGMLALIGWWRPPAPYLEGILLALLALRLKYGRETGDPILFVLGAMGGALVTWALLARATIILETGPARELPAWVPLFWGHATLIARRGVRSLERLLNPFTPYDF